MSARGFVMATPQPGFGTARCG